FSIFPMLHQRRLMIGDGFPRLEPKGWEGKMALLQRQLDYLDRGMRDMEYRERRGLQAEMYFSGYRAFDPGAYREVSGSNPTRDIHRYRSGVYGRPSVSSGSSMDSLSTTSTVPGASREDLSSYYRVLDSTESWERRPRQTIDDKAVQASVGDTKEAGNSDHGRSEAESSGKLPVVEGENEWERAARAYRQSRTLDGEITFRPATVSQTPSKVAEEPTTPPPDFADLLRQRMDSSEEPLPNFGRQGGKSETVEHDSSDADGEVEASASTILKKSRGLKPLKAVRILGDGGSFACIVMGDRGHKQEYELLVRYADDTTEWVKSKNLK
ncbi:hypothetical protein FOZ63_010276, partial [Perkinsus olseni]